MSATPTPDTAKPSAWTPLALVYLALSVIGLLGTWYFNLTFVFGPHEAGYIESWFANRASSSAAIDVIVAANVACIFFIAEGRRIGMRWAWLFIPLAFAIALAAAFPLFLALRERHLAGQARSGRAATTG